MTKQKYLFLLFEQGILASFKLPQKPPKKSVNTTNETKNDDEYLSDFDNDEYLESLMELEDDLLWDMLIPAFVALLATGSIWLNRRL